MSEFQSVVHTQKFQSKSLLKKQLLQLGVQPGDSIMVHASMKAMGWIAGGPQAVVEALMEMVTSEGTIVMPSQSADNSEPSYWMMPPVPEEWNQPIRDHMPAFDPHLTPLRGMGKIAECFHRHPKTLRSMHPAHSFTAWGRRAEHWMSEHPLEDSFGESSPLGKMMKEQVKIVLIGVGFDSCTALHFAEYAQENRKASPQGAAIMVEGERLWQTYACVDMDSDRFPELASEYPGAILKGKLGQAETMIVDMRSLVEFGIRWLRDHPAAAE
ncbi:aminoglycoside N(3)-acetyltransferase [Mesobacillus foraminis]|uniref:Aminoglycoside N(3)-acetyltransferase n=1 Tax=Mesobacillus foraminis TaxID=279826 RepID=A0A4R2BJW9_9BACI|nr:AAC(3) family N-acetyltransferase [Mesobacillus foraminis]TCN27286.1 aminoglycoside 3-N-acetyltransferase [Mesobacillus foraminis]